MKETKSHTPLRRNGAIHGARVGLLLAALLIRCVDQAFALPVTSDQVRQVAMNFLGAEQARVKRLAEVEMSNESSRTAPQVPEALDMVEATPIQTESGVTVAHVLHLSPAGFLIVSADSDLPPVVAFSLDRRFSAGDPASEFLKNLVASDLGQRLRGAALAPDTLGQFTRENNERWESYLARKPLNGGPKGPKDATQWPADRDGWVTTQWNQYPNPYNTYCPLLDPTNPSRGRCVVGCTATAMGQIVDYWKYPARLRFSTSRDTYTSRGTEAGVIQIDADASIRGFPSFLELTSALSQISYDDSASHIGYLSFGLGVKLHMNYGTSSGANLSAQAFTEGCVIRVCPT